MATTTDFIVIGGGMAGSSAAYELAAFGRVYLLERENQPGYHSTGRSAATLIDTYGNPVVNGLTVASRTFIESPPAVFGDDPVFERRGMLLIAREDQLPSLDREMAAAPGKFARLTGAEAVARIPVLDPDYVAAAVHDSTAIDLDVHAIQQGYLRGARERGAETLMGAEVRRLERADGLWQVTTDSDTYTAPVVVNAAGAWADAIAGLAGLAPLGVVPKRRTAINIDPPDGISVASWPMAVDVDEQFYFKPDAGRLLVSPADETPSPPVDAQPEELDIAIAVDRFERATTMAVRRVSHQWAGLRCFVADKTPVAGAASDADGFYWLVGQGGYGIMTAPAMAWAIAAAITGEDLPPDLARTGVTTADLSPDRLLDVG
jgi:D-arginine dehydrogenase